MSGLCQQVGTPRRRCCFPLVTPRARSRVARAAVGMAQRPISSFFFKPAAKPPPPPPAEEDAVAGGSGRGDADASADADVDAETRRSDDGDDCDATNPSRKRARDDDDADARRELMRRKLCDDTVSEAKRAEVAARFAWLSDAANLTDRAGRRRTDPAHDPRTFALPANMKLSASQRQYWDLKSTHADVVLFFKVGKFYELYEDDAEIGCRVLDWKMTVSGVGHCRQVGCPESGIDAAVRGAYASRARSSRR